MAKQFMVVRYPKNETLLYLDKNENTIYQDYNIAFDVFNELVSKESSQQFKQPKGERPVKAVLENDVLELWVVDYAEELITV